MIDKLRKKIFWSIECSVMALLLMILLVFNGVNLWNREKEEWAMMHAEAEALGIDLHMNGNPAPQAGSGSAQPEMTDPAFAPGEPERQMRGRPQAAARALMGGELGILQIRSDGEVQNALGFFEDYTEEKIAEIRSRLEGTGKSAGRIDGMKFVIGSRADGTQTIVCLDTEFLFLSTIQLLLVSLLLFGVAAVLFAVVARGISGRIVRPVSQTMESQKRFIADASHELKTPVTVINANISLLEKEIGENQWLGYIREEGQRMTGLVESLLKISRLEYEKEYRRKPEPKVEYDAVRCVEKTALPFESLAFESGCRLEMELPDTLPAKGYPADLEQLTGILLDNAIKHCSKGGEVRICLTRKEKEMVLRVENTGEEIPQEDLEHIFDRFYKRDSSRKFESNSFGLGLAIAKAIAEKNDAVLEAYSKDGVTGFVIRI